jgi:hypothetical protein
MNRYVGWVMVCSMTLTLAACAAQTSQNAGSSAAAPAESIGVPPPPSSPLARVRLGMDKKQVKDVLGAPTDENSYATGKVFIPFYFGNDARRTSYYYKGMGRVVFADGNAFGGGGTEVIRVDYDPTESGQSR